MPATEKTPADEARIMSSKSESARSNAPVLDEAYWLRFGDVPDPALREKLICVCIGEMSRRGLLDVSARSLSELLGVSHPVINYHFGSFDGLIAEAYAWVYRDWTSTLIEAIEAPAKNPEERLRTMIRRTAIERSRRIGPMLALTHIPHPSDEIERILDERFPQLREDAIEFGLCVNGVLIRDLRKGDMTPISFTPGAVPLSKLMLSMPAELIAAASLQLSINGLGMWATGGWDASPRLTSLPTRLSQKVALDAHVERIIDSMR